MRRIWNVSPYPLALDMRKPAVRSCGWVTVDDDTAEELTGGPDWSYENPRQPPRFDRLVIRQPRSVEDDGSVEMVSEGSLVAAK